LEWRGKLERVTILEDGYALNGKPVLQPKMRSNRADKVALRAGDGWRRQALRLRTAVRRNCAMYLTLRVSIVPSGYRWGARPCPVGRASHGGTCDCLEMPQGISRLPFFNDRVVRWAARSPSAPASLKREAAQAVVQRAAPLLAQPEAATAHGKPALEAAHGQPALRAAHGKPALEEARE
jgi:hypothetical protein